MKTSTYIIIAGISITLISCSLAYVAYQIRKSVHYIQNNIEQALPILKSASIEVAESQLLKDVPEVQEILKQDDEQALVRAATKPVVKTALEIFKIQLNNVLPLIKIDSIDYNVDANDVKDIALHCSYGINMRITGHKFNHLLTTTREGHILKFVCD